MKKEEKEILQAYISVQVRDSLEYLHRGIEVNSLSGDFTDVKVITPEEEIPWNELKLISEKEMHYLMIKIEESIQNALDNYEQSKKDPELKDCINYFVEVAYYYKGPSWNRKDYNLYAKGLEEHINNLNNNL